MHFGLSEEQTLLQETVRSFVRNECGPSRLRELFEAGAGHDDALWKGLCEIGLAGLVVPEEYGGAGLERIDLALVCEVLGAGALPAPLLEHSLACIAIAEGGSEEQRRRWLPALASGERVATVAIGEPDERWDPGDWTVSHRDGRLTGSKIYVPNAGAADLLLVGVAGGDFAVVDAGASGVAIEAQDGIDRTRPVASVQLDAAAAESLTGGVKLSRRVLDAGLAGLAADAFGAATHLLELSVDYAKTRKQFGRPIAGFQAVKHQLARIATSIEPTRALFWYAAHALDAGLSDGERSAALAKAHITDRALHAAREAVELHGGLGFTWDCDVQIWFKRAMFDRAFLGGPHAQRERCARLAGWQ